MYLMTPNQELLDGNQSMAPAPIFGGQIPHQPQPIWLVSQNMAPVNFSGAMHMHAPMPLVYPMIPIPAQEVKNMSSQYDNLSHGRQAIESEGLDVFRHLQGYWETDIPAAKKFELVIVGYGDQRRALVRNACTEKEPFTHQISYEQDSRFTLCSMEGHVEAVMPKGSIAKDFVKWYTNDCRWVIWRRLVLNSIVMSSSGGNHVPELSTSVSGQLRPNSMSDHSERVPSNKLLGNLSVTKTQSSSFCEPTMPQSQPCEHLFNLFQAHCKKNPLLLEEVLNWEISRSPKQPVAEKDILELSQGRLWVSARLTRFAKKDCGYWQRILDEIKGAYLEVTPGVYQQPYQPHENEGWHRLRKSKRGRWMIEKYIEERGV